MPTEGTFQDLALQLGELVDDKRATYGDSIASVEACMLALYPRGIRPEQYKHALITVRSLDKHSRLATGGDAVAEDSYMDLAGYGLRGLEAARRKGQCQPTSVRQQHRSNAAVSGAGRKASSRTSASGSAMRTAKQKTTTTAKEKGARRHNAARPANNPSDAGAAGRGME